MSVLFDNLKQKRKRQEGQWNYRWIDREECDTINIARTQTGTLVRCSSVQCTRTQHKWQFIRWHFVCWALCVCCYVRVCMGERNCMCVRERQLSHMVHHDMIMCYSQSLDRVLLVLSICTCVCMCAVIRWLERKKYPMRIESPIGISTKLWHIR